MIFVIIANSYSLRCFYHLGPTCCCFVKEFLKTSFECASLRVRATGSSIILDNFTLISMLIPSVYGSAKSFGF